MGWNSQGLLFYICVLHFILRSFILKGQYKGNICLNRMGAYTFIRYSKQVLFAPLSQKGHAQENFLVRVTALLEENDLQPTKPKYAVWSDGCLCGR